MLWACLLRKKWASYQGTLVVLLVPAPRLRELRAGCLQILLLLYFELQEGDSYMYEHEIRYHGCIDNGMDDMIGYDKMHTHKCP